MYLALYLIPRPRRPRDDRGPTMSREDANTLLATGEVAALFGVDPKTVTRWASRGQLAALRTPGGHRRFRLDEVETKVALYRSGGRLPRPRAAD